MTSMVHTVSAAEFALDALAALFTASFTGYVYARVVTAEQLARRVRAEQIDLFHSRVLVVDDKPAGLALVALRGEWAWCGGFGVVPAQRGQGHAAILAAALVAQAAMAGAVDLSLEVLTGNAPAIATYRRAGFLPTRELLVLHWRRPSDDDAALSAPAPSAAVSRVPAATVLGDLTADPAAAWQRALPTLLTQPDLRGYALPSGAAALVAALDAGGGALVAVRSARAADTAALLAALQSEYTTLLCVNEPAASPHLAALQAAGLVEIDRQHELHRALP